MTQVYNLAYWLHIISYLSWLIAFVGSLFYGVRVYFEKAAPEKRNFMRLERLVTSIGAHIGAIGILISGVVMSSFPGGPQWGWFHFQLYPWLALKQVLFIGILLLVGFSIKRSLAFKKKVRQDQEKLSAEAANLWASAYRTSIAVYILVTINTILGLEKFNLAF